MCTLAGPRVCPRDCNKEGVERIALWNLQFLNFIGLRVKILTFKNCGWALKRGKNMLWGQQSFIFELVLFKKMIHQHIVPFIVTKFGVAFDHVTLLKCLNLYYIVNLLCIFTSKSVLQILITGQNHLFQRFDIFFHHEQKKRRKSA